MKNTTKRKKKRERYNRQLKKEKRTGNIKMRTAMKDKIK